MDVSRDRRLRMFAALCPVGGLALSGRPHGYRRRTPLRRDHVIIDSAFVNGFVFWGGDFWLFLSPSVSPGPEPSVGRYKTSDGSFTQVVATIGFDPAGAGVSVCAPVAPPK
jgi:hypothetical protein